LAKYVYDNIGFIVCDFFKVEDELNSDLKTCDFKVSSDVAFIIQNAKTLRVWESVMDVFIWVFSRKAGSDYSLSLYSYTSFRDAPRCSYPLFVKILSGCLM